MPDVFISFRSGDEEGTAALVERYLSDRFGTDRIFRDSKSIAPGEEFAPALLAAVRASKVLLAVIGPRWLTARDGDGRRALDNPADWIRRELLEARACGVRVVPVLVGDQPKPLSEDTLPAALRWLAGCQHRRLSTRNDEHDLRRIADELAGLVPALAAIDAAHAAAPTPGRAHSDDEFVAVYQEFMSRTLDSFEFFGVDPRGVARRHRFRSGYVRLTLNQQDIVDSSTVTVGARADRALVNSNRALIRGVAGSGKSTLLRWLGAEAAQYHAQDGKASVPFLLELGRFVEGRPPDLEQVIAATLRRGMPARWVDRMLGEGQVLLLLDGLDEIRARDRVHLEDWVEEHLDLYPDTRCFVTTRPTIVAEQWWVDRDFQRFDLLPMSRHSIEEYVHGWHEAARSDQPNTPGGDEVREDLVRCEQSLLSTLSNRRALRGMSANPLLCGLLCALHLERGEYLPENRKQIYDAALDLLLLRWRHLRRRRLNSRGTLSGPVDGTELAGNIDDRSDASGVDASDPPLRDEELLKLFQRLAYWMVINRRQLLEREVAVRRVTSYMSGLRNSAANPVRVVNYLAHHSGLLRELPDGSLTFIHRTFRDHLAAKEVVEEENLGLLLESANKPHWHDVVVMAGAHARPGERTRILLELLENGRTDAEHRSSLFLLAAAVLEQSAVLPEHDGHSPDVRGLVAEAIAELIPPHSAAAADQLAAAGPFVLDLLPSPAELTDPQADLVVRAAARIAAQWNPAGAIEKILQFTKNPTKGAIAQLLETWGRLGDYEAYARDVLSEIDFGHFRVDLQTGRRIEHIGYLRTLTWLRLRNNIHDLAPVARLPRLRRLTLRDNTMTSLAPLVGTRSLRVLVLDRCSWLAGARPVDLSPVGELPVRRLVISGLTTDVLLGSLAGVDLVSLRLTARLTRSPVLPGDLRVRHLTLARGGGRLRFAGLDSVVSLIIDRAPDADLLAALRTLPGLRRLVLFGVPADTPAPDLPGVSVLVLPGRSIG